MPNDPKDDLRPLSSSLNLDPAAIDEASSIQAKTLLTLIEQNKERDRAAQHRDEVYTRIFTKLDAVEAAAAEAKIAAADAKAHANLLITRINHQDNDILPEIKSKVDKIDTTTTETNGKVKKLRQEMDKVTPDLGTLMKERRAKILDEEAARLRREGLWVLPRTIKEGIQWFWKKVAYPVLGALGTIALAWPALQWMWEHRIIWGKP